MNVKHFEPVPNELFGGYDHILVDGLTFGQMFESPRTRCVQVAGAFMRPWGREEMNINVTAAGLENIEQVYELLNGPDDTLAAGWRRCFEQGWLFNADVPSMEMLLCRAFDDALAKCARPLSANDAVRLQATLSAWWALPPWDGTWRPAPQDAPVGYVRFTFVSHCCEYHYKDELPYRGVAIAKTGTPGVELALEHMHDVHFGDWKRQMATQGYSNALIWEAQSWC